VTLVVGAASFAPAGPGYPSTTGKQPKGEAMSTSNTETGNITGTRDKDYNLIWFVESCLNNALRMEQYQADAQRDGDSEVAELFAKAQSDSRKGAELGKALLRKRLGSA
jgi:methylthioribose-1-phosphate isomerase